VAQTVREFDTFDIFRVLVTDPGFNAQAQGRPVAFGQGVAVEPIGPDGLRVTGGEQIDTFVIKV